MYTLKGQGVGKEENPLDAATGQTDMAVPTVFLGGTCGGDLWRLPFLDRFKALGVDAYDPQVQDWQPWRTALENRCLQESPLVLFPVLTSTLGLGSLGEVGFTVLYVLRDIMAGTPRNLVLLIEPTCTTQADPSLLRESVRMRALVRSKAEAEARKTGIHLVDTLDEMMAVAERLLTHKTLSP